MANVTQLDPGQVIKGAYDEPSQSIRTKITGTVPVTIVDGDITGLTVILTYEVPFSSINGSGGALYQLTASTPAQISLIVPNEQTGVAISVYVGASLLVILAPGQDNEVNAVIPAGSSISIRATDALAPTAGSFFITFVG